jgi:hypothetical protein
MGRLELRRIEAAGGRNRKFVLRGQCLEARFVEQVFHEVGVCDDKAERLGQSPAMARDQEGLPVFLVEQHRRLGLGRAECDESIEQPFGVAAIVVPGER